MEMMRVLTRHFGLSAVEAKAMCMQSRSFWRAFFLEHIEEMIENKGSRFGAVNYIRRKNDPLDNGELLFTDEEIEQMVDSVGEWEK